MSPCEACFPSGSVTCLVCNGSGYGPVPEDEPMMVTERKRGLHNLRVARIVDEAPMILPVGVRHLDGDILVDVNETCPCLLEARAE